MSIKGGGFMFIKVIINQYGEIYREDNGELIGELALRIGNHFLTKEGKLAELKFGFFNQLGNFKELCKQKNCSFECLSKERPNCRYIKKGDETEGYYYLCEE